MRMSSSECVLRIACDAERARVSPSGEMSTGWVGRACSMAMAVPATGAAAESGATPAKDEKKEEKKDEKKEEEALEGLSSLFG